MTSLIIGVILLLSGLVLYNKRFTSDFKVGGLYLVQFYYLLLSPLVSTLVLNLSLEIYNRPTIYNLPINNIFLLDFSVFSLFIAAIGTGIHSTSTSVFQAFKHGVLFEKNAFKTNEQFHQPLSHNMLYLGTILASISLSLLEINHPYTGLPFNLFYLVCFGILIGVIETLAIVWSTHMGFSLLFSVAGSVILGYLSLSFSDFHLYPLTVALLVSLITLSILIGIYTIAFLASEGLSKRLVHRTFPKGHPFHEVLDLKVLTKKIVRDWD